MATNNPSPLIPQGSLIGRQGKSHIRIAVFTILAIHIVLLGALLLQGCKRTTDSEPPAPPTPTNISWQALQPPDLPPLNTLTSATPVLPSSPSPGTTSAPPPIPNPVPPSIPSYPPPGMPPTDPPIPEPISPPIGEVPVETTPPVSEPSGTEHVIASGDTFFDLARKYGTTAKAIADRNPNVDPRRLKIGQNLYIPAPVAAAPAEDTSSANRGRTVYVVQSGDNLTKIAEKYGTTVKALRVENNLPTDRIKVGDKLTIPASANNP